MLGLLFDGFERADDLIGIRVITPVDAHDVVFHAGCSCRSYSRSDPDDQAGELTDDLREEEFRGRICASTGLSEARRRLAATGEKAGWTEG
jgi:hypothetical protein